MEETNQITNESHESHEESPPSPTPSTSTTTTSSPPPSHSIQIPLEKQQSVKDRYGFLLPQDSIELHRSNEQKKQLVEKETERAKKWIKMKNNWEHTITHHSEKLRQRLRKGIPDSLRCDIWLKLSHVNDLKRVYPNRFLLQQPADVPELTIDEIERDINRTFPTHDFFENGSGIHHHGQESLRRILQSYASFDPETGYCQGMGFIAAMFLIYMVEEDAFYALLALLQVPLLLFLVFLVLLVLLDLFLSLSTLNLLTHSLH